MSKTFAFNDFGKSILAKVFRTCFFETTPQTSLLERIALLSLYKQFLHQFNPHINKERQLIEAAIATKEVERLLVSDPHPSKEVINLAQVVGNTLAIKALKERGITMSGRTVTHIASPLFDPLFDLALTSLSLETLYRMNPDPEVLPSQKALGTATSFHDVENCRNSINKKDDNGMSLMHWATGAGNLPAVEILLQRGAIDSLNNHDESALSFAKMAGNEYLAGILEAHGNKQIPSNKISPMQLRKLAEGRGERCR